MLDTVTKAHAVALIQQPGYIKTADAVSLFYRDWGSGKPPLFLSGWTLASQMWACQMNPLSEQGFRCIAYDRRAHGRSSDPGRGYDFDSLADDLAVVIEALHLDGVTLVAHSFASGEVVRYLSRHGAERVAGVVLVAPAAIPFLLKTHDNPTGVDEAVFDQLRAVLAEDFSGWAEANAERYFAGIASRAMIDATMQMMNLTSYQAMLTMSHIRATTDFRPELARIRTPTLLIDGDCDASVPVELTSRPAAALIPGARLEVYEGEPHGLYFTHKARLNQDIVRFVAGLGGKA